MPRADCGCAARQILKAVERNRRRALIGPDAVVFDAVSRLPAGLYQRVLAGGARLQRRERALMVFAALVPLVIAVAFLLVELISGNP